MQAASVNYPSSILNVLNPQSHLLALHVTPPISPESSSSIPTILLCHGHASCSHCPLIVHLVSHLRPLYPSHAIVRLDFCGNGHSEGPFRYANYRDEAADIWAAVTDLESKSYHVTTVAGHSKGATSALLYAVYHASKHSSVANVIVLAGRWHIGRGIKERFGEDNLARIDTGESVTVKANKWNKEGLKVPFEYQVSKEDIIERKSIQRNDIVQGVKQNKLGVVIVHAKTDSIIPCEDANDMELDFRSAGIPVRKFIFEDGGHSFINKEDQVASCILKGIKENEN